MSTCTAMMGGRMRGGGERREERVVNLHGYDGSAVLPEHPLELQRELGVELFDVSHVGRAVGAQRDAFREEPVRMSAVAAFAMIPRTDSR